MISRSTAPNSYCAGSVENVRMGEFGKKPASVDRHPTILFAPDDTLPLDVDGSIKPKFAPTSPPARLFAPLPVTEVVSVQVIARPHEDLGGILTFTKAAASPAKTNTSKSDGA